MLPLLEKLTDTENRTEVGDSCHWVTSINRGGLTKITDEAFQCFYDIEVHIRRFLNIKNTRVMNKNFSKKVINSVLSDDDLLFDWCFAASESIDQDVADKCLMPLLSFTEEALSCCCQNTDENVVAESVEFCWWFINIDNSPL